MEVMRGRKKRNQDLEAAGAAFLATVESPHAPDRLREYGLRRVLARAEGEAGAGRAPTVRRAYRNPAVLRHALIVALVVVLILLVSTSGVYAFSLGAQPDSPLYGAKIFFERARVALNTSGAGDIRLEMGFSQRRMKELGEMYAANNREGAERWLREYSRNIEGAGILFETVENGEAEQLSLRFQEMLEAHARMMEGMLEGDPTALSQPIESAYHVCDMERERMRRRCGRPDADGGGEPGGQEHPGQGGCPGVEGEYRDEAAPSFEGDTLDGGAEYGERDAQAGDTTGGGEADAGGQATAAEPSPYAHDEDEANTGGNENADTSSRESHRQGGHMP